MNRHLPFVFAAAIALIVSSCKEVSFPIPQPKGVNALTELPSSLRGRYVVGDPTEEKKDTLIIESWGYHFKDSNEKDWLGKGTISDSLIVKLHKNFYFINFRSGDQWVLRVVQQLPSGALEFMSIDVKEDEAEQAMVSKLSKKMDVKKLEIEDGTFYQINPSPKQLMSLIEEGYFSKIVLEKQK
jgi:hypothetical protein